MRNGNHFYHLNTIKKSFDETFKCFYVSRPFIFFVYIFFCPGFLQVKSETESKKWLLKMTQLDSHRHNPG